MKPETRWKILAILAFLATAWLALSWWATARELGKAETVIDKYAAEELERQGYDDGAFKEPKIADAPAGTTAIVRATGMVRYLPKSGAPTAISLSSPGTVDGPQLMPGSPMTPDVPRGNPCSLDDLDVTLRCTVEALATPTRPWAKLTQSATVSAWGQTREFPWMPAGDVKLEVAPSVVPPRWHLDLLSGVAAGERFGLEVGATWTGKSRLGPYLMVEWQPAVGGSSYRSESYSYSSSGEPSTWRVHAGIRFRIR